MTIWCMFIACWIPKATNAHKVCVIFLFHCNNGYTNVPRYYFILTLPVLLGFAMAFHAVCKPTLSVRYMFWGCHGSVTLTVFWHVGIAENGGSRVYPKVESSLLGRMLSQHTEQKHFCYLTVLSEFFRSAN